METVVKKFDELSLIELYEILKLRAEVFVVEQNCVYQDLDNVDQEAYHVYLQDEGKRIIQMQKTPVKKSNAPWLPKHGSPALAEFPL